MGFVAMAGLRHRRRGAGRLRMGADQHGTGPGQPDFTWSGHAPSGSSDWSLGANWAGGLAPGGSVGTLTFPNTGCGSGPCATSTNDLSGLAVGALSIDDTSPYAIGGNAISVGAGEITAPSSAGNGVANTALRQLSDQPAAVRPDQLHRPRGDGDHPGAEPVGEHRSADDLRWHRAVPDADRLSRLVDEQPDALQLPMVRL